MQIMVPAPTSPRSGHVRSEAQWRVLPGMAYGIGQPIMVGTLHVDIPDGVDLRAIDGAMTVILAEALPPTLDLPGSPPLALARRMLFWSAVAQRIFHLPAIDWGYAWQPRPEEAPGTVCVAVPYTVAQASLASLDWASRCVSSLVERAGPVPALEQEIRNDLARLGELLKTFAIYGFNTVRFLTAARTLGMPTRLVVSNVFCFGQGRHGRWLESSYTDHTAVIAARIARDKLATARLLRQAGLPVAQHAPVATPEQAVKIARQMEGRP